jgi:hypothetical protein
VSIVSGIRSGIRSGINPSDGGDVPITWTVDATSGIALPADSTEWDDFRAAELLAIATPGHLYTCQEASGDLIDQIGAVPLADAGTPLFQQAIAGYDRDAVRMDANTDRFSSASVPSPYATSVVMLMLVSLPAQPGANLVIGGPHINGSATGGLFVSHASANGSIFIRVNGNTATGTLDHSSGVHPILVKYDRTNSVARVYTDLEKISPAYQALSGAFSVGGLGSTAGNVSFCGLLYAAVWSGADAEAFTDANAKALLAAMNFTPPWS